MHSFSIACLSGNLSEPLVKQGMAEVQEQMENGKGSMADLNLAIMMEVMQISDDVDLALITC